MKKMNKRAAVPIIYIILGLLAVGAIALSSGVSLNKLMTGSLDGSGSYIQSPIFYYDKCEATGPLVRGYIATNGALQENQEGDIANSGQWLPKPSVTNQYTANINTPGASGLGDAQFEYAVCNQKLLDSSCSVPLNTVKATQGLKNYQITGVRNNEYVWVHFKKSVFYSAGYGDAGGAKYTISFIPYGLREYNVLSGSSVQVNPNDCVDNRASKASFIDRILGTDSSIINSEKTKDGKPISASINQQTFSPEEVRWYIAGHLTSAAPSSTFTYQGVQAWCRQTGQSGQIYKVNTVNLASGTYKIASADFSDNLGSVACCPGEVSGSSVCQSDFTYKTIVDSTCGGFQSCGSPNWVPYSTKTLIMYSCNSKTGKCESQTKNVGCANDKDCTDTNQVCDLNSYTCVKANTALDGQIIKTVPDGPAACQEQGGKWITKTTTTKEGILCYAPLGLGLCSDKVIVNEYCDTSGTNWLSIIIWIIVILVIIILLVMFFPAIRSVLKSIPFIGKIIP